MCLKFKTIVRLVLINGMLIQTFQTSCKKDISEGEKLAKYIVPPWYICI